MLTRDEAVSLIKKYLKDINNVRFSVSVEAVLRKIAGILQKDEELWGITGLLYNLDYEYSKGSPEKRTILTAQLLEGLLPDSALNAIKANNYMHSDYIPTTSLDKTLIATVAATELIDAVKNKTSTKNIIDVSINEVMVKFNDSSFEERINRNRIALCEDVGLDIDSFLNLCLKTFKEILE
jgi:predicted hydrolase (HD superfamily)